MKKILLLSVLIISFTAKSQTLENQLATSICKYVDSVDMSKIITPQDKKKAILFVFAKAVEANQTALKKDKRFTGLQNYEQGKKLGQLMAQSVTPLLTNNCPKFKRLIN